MWTPLCFIFCRGLELHMNFYLCRYINIWLVHKQKLSALSRCIKWFLNIRITDRVLFAHVRLYLNCVLFNVVAHELSFVVFLKIVTSRRSSSALFRYSFSVKLCVRLSQQPLPLPVFQSQP